MKNLKTLASAIWRFGHNERVRTFHTPRDIALDESELIERREYELRNEQQRAEEEELARIANEAQRQLAAFEALIGRSQGDAQSFGDELQAVTERDRGREQAAALIALTNAMIAKTRIATEELRTRREEMQGLHGALDEARKRADTDMLTGLANRRSFERNFAMHIERAAADGTPLALAICDIDHFKSINDQFGHQTGDGVLKLVAKILTEHCSRDGSVFRIGGEEFAALFPAVDGDAALAIIDAVRVDLNSRKIRQRGTGEYLGHVTLSAGIAVASPTSVTEAQSLFADADRALYAAKEAGRNQISLGPQAPTPAR
jgi:diguanylate cyclase